MTDEVFCFLFFFFEPSLTCLILLLPAFCSLPMFSKGFDVCVLWFLCARYERGVQFSGLSQGECQRLSEVVQMRSRGRSWPENLLKTSCKRLWDALCHCRKGRAVHRSHLVLSQDTW